MFLKKERLTTLVNLEQETKKLRSDLLGNEVEGGCDLEEGVVLWIVAGVSWRVQDNGLTCAKSAKRGCGLFWGEET